MKSRTVVIHQCWNCPHLLVVDEYVNRYRHCGVLNKTFFVDACNIEESYEVMAQWFENECPLPESKE